MRKTILLLSFLFTVGGVVAQQNTEDRGVGTTTKAGQKILPQAGDIAIGIDATPFLKYAGNALNGTSNNDAPGFQYNDNVFGSSTIFGKYFLTDNTALRVKLHLGFYSETDKELVVDANNSDKKVEDSRTLSQNGLGLSVGYETRRGYGRLQGFYGAEAGLGFTSRSTSYDYGNKWTSGSMPPSAWNVGGTRPIDYSYGSTFQGMLGGFTGVEYFIAPKLSVGAELGVGLRFTSTGKATGEYQVVKVPNGGVMTEKEEVSGGASSFSFAANYRGALNVIFHF